MSTPPPISRSGAQHQAQQELSKSVYHRHGDPLPVRAVKWLGHLIDRALNATVKHGPSGDLGALALIVIVVALIAVLVWRVGIPRRADAVRSTMAVDPTMTAAQHRAAAERAAQDGDWDRAVAERMRAVARELEERSIIDPRAGRTATELARDAAVALPSLATSLDTAAELFNRTVYGGTTATAADYDQLAAADDGVRRSSRSQAVPV